MVSRGLPNEEEDFLGYSKDRRWCPGDSPLTEVDLLGLLRVKVGVQGILH